MYCLIVRQKKTAILYRVDIESVSLSRRISGSDAIQSSLLGQVSGNDRSDVRYDNGICCDLVHNCTGGLLDGGGRTPVPIVRRNLKEDSGTYECIQNENVSALRRHIARQIVASVFWPAGLRLLPLCGGCAVTRSSFMM